MRPPARSSSPPPRSWRSPSAAKPPSQPGDDLRNPPSRPADRVAELGVRAGSSHGAPLSRRQLRVGNAAVADRADDLARSERDAPELDPQRRAADDRVLSPRLEAAQEGEPFLPELRL